MFFGSKVSTSASSQPPLADVSAASERQTRGGDTGTFPACWRVAMRKLAISKRTLAFARVSCMPALSPAPVQHGQSNDGGSDF